MRRLFPLIMLVLTLSSGCELFEWVAPHQLWKLNRQPPLGGRDGYFSIPAEPRVDVGSDAPTSPKTPRNNLTEL